MTAALTPEAEQSVSNIAARYGLSTDAVVAMLYAVNSGGGTMAQFSIPELGGSGQWMRGGMTMVGNMFDNNLKARVDNLCNELSPVAGHHHRVSARPGRGGWVADSRVHRRQLVAADLGVPSSTGAQNGARYAIFPATPPAWPSNLAV